MQSLSRTGVITNLQPISPNLSRNSNIEFSDFSATQISNTGLPLALPPLPIYQSPLTHFTISEDIYLLPQRPENATVIMNNLYKLLNYFDVESAQDRENLIKFISSPRAQKALKCLSQNSEELGLKAGIGEEFALLFTNWQMSICSTLKEFAKNLIKTLY